MPLRFALLGVLLAVSPLAAECVELTVLRREPFAGGKEFGDAGAYERIVGVAKFAVDPKNKRNQVIVDLDKAPRNQDGRVEFTADVFILAPKEPAKGNGAILYDVNNRGNKLALSFFNDAPGTNDPSTAEHAGNGFLLRRGYAIVWCGWIGELLPGSHRLLLKAPVATENGKPITGVVRFETGTDGKVETLLLSRRDGHGSYDPTAKGEREGVLSWRMREGDPRVVIPREQWSLIRVPPEPVKEGVPGTLSQIRLKVAGGFRPGYLYELICECENPIVQGCGFAAVRDLVSFLRHDGSEKNPLAAKGKSPIDRTLGFGISQSGRFLRHFVYEGFNADEKDRKVFDGLMPHVAGGGLGFFNHRFAQPTRHNGQHEDHLYPADVFPFTYGESANDPTILEKGELVGGPFRKRGRKADPDELDSILARFTKANEPQFIPRIMHTQSGAEYWHRSGSLVHTDLGSPIEDSAIPESVRIYTFGSSQHGPASDPPKPGNGDNLPNPANFKPLSRALLVALDGWVKSNVAPPPSVYPTIRGKTLVEWRQSQTGFPEIPGVRYPDVIQQPEAADYGRDFYSKRIITVEPPRILGNYPVLVPRSDTDGNDLGCLLPPEVAVPLATYTGWNLRKKEIGAEGMLLSLQGSYIPFPKTAAERQATGDPRRSIEERYGSFAEYEQQFRAVCAKYVKERYLLPEDAEKLIAAREKVRGLFPKKR
jgi:hypothetical protein